jgi:hypothetical protein
MCTSRHTYLTHLISPLSLTHLISPHLTSPLLSSPLLSSPLLSHLTRSLTTTVRSSVIDYFRRPRSIRLNAEHDVGRLEISMHQTHRLMQIVHSGADVVCDADTLLKGKSPCPLANVLFQGTARVVRCNQQVVWRCDTGCDQIELEDLGVRARGDVLTSGDLQNKPTFTCTHPLYLSLSLALSLSLSLWLSLSLALSLQQLFSYSLSLSLSLSLRPATRLPTVLG